MRSLGLGGSAVPAAVAERADRPGDLDRADVRRRPSTRRSPAPRHDDPSSSASTPTAGRWPASRSCWSTTTASRWRRAARRDPQPGPRLLRRLHRPGAHRRRFDDDGWYHTGDIGILDDDGYLRITDRKKDVIIRGGENISAAEVEEVLAQMPGVAEVAVVAAPDERLGEQVCACVRMLPGAVAPDLDAVRSPCATPAWPARSGRRSCECRRLPAHAVGEDPEDRAPPAAGRRGRSGPAPLGSRLAPLGSQFHDRHYRARGTEAGPDPRLFRRCGYAGGPVGTGPGSPG